MNRTRFISESTGVILALASFTSLASGATMIHFNNITPTANVSASAEFPVSEISDGVTNEGNPSGLNGFMSASLGTITFTFDQDYELNSLLLWNDVNLNGDASEGIDSFSLAFFDSSDAVIATPSATTYTAPVEQLTAQEYIFSGGVEGVRRVDLEVLSSQWTGNTAIEIREVAFTEVAASMVPEPSITIFLGISAIGLFGRRKRSN